MYGVDIKLSYGDKESCIFIDIVSILKRPTVEWNNFKLLLNHLNKVRSKIDEYNKKYHNIYILIISKWMFDGDCQIRHHSL